MKTRKVILNDSGKPMTKNQARKEAETFILEQVLKGFEGGNAIVEIQEDATIDAAGEVTLRNLLDLSAA